MLLCSAAFVQASNVTWLGGVSTDFENGSNWVGASAPSTNVNKDIAVFTGSLTLFQPSLSASRGINGLNFGSAGWILGGSSFTLTLDSGGITTTNSSGTNTINTNIALNTSQSWSIATGGTLQMNGVISGSNTSYTLTKSGGGTLVLAASDTYLGPTAITAGTLIAASNNALGTTDSGTTVSSGASLGFQGGITYSTAEAVTINGTGVSSLGAITNVSGTNSFAGAITLGSASTIGSQAGTLTLSGTINNGGFLLTMDGVGNITANGVISGTGALTKSGTGTLTLGGTNTYTGGTNINAGILSLGSSGALGTSGTISFGGGTLQYSASNTTDYSGRFSAAASQAYSIDTNSQNVTFASALTSASGSLTKLGSGTLTLSGASTYTGATTINGGTLKLDSAGSTTARLAGTTSITVNAGGTLLMANSSGTTSNDRINNAATMTLNGGTFNTGGLSEHGASNNTAGIGALTLQSTSIIDMGSGSSVIAFADSHLSSWTGTLRIYNWSGTPAYGGGTDQLYFGSTSGGLTSTQLGEISFYSDGGSTILGAAVILADGEIVPVPEPGTWLAGALVLGMLGYSQRNRLSGSKKSAFAGG